MSKNVIYTLFCLLFLIVSCSSKDKTTARLQDKKTAEVPSFNADSAYYYTDKQVAFGPRVPNTDAHKACGDYLAGELKRHGAEVIEQEAELYTYSNIKLNARNIIGSFSSEKTNRVLLCAHWDSRPFADYDPDPKNYRTPIDGANDGAGACAALLEIARQVGMQQPNIGIDIIFFDAEDWGTPSFERKGASTGWCLGSEYWAKNPHKADYRAKYGILLDMVSAPNARFYREYYSTHYAKNIVDKVWRAAEALGYGNYFINQMGGGVEDDHIRVNEYCNIPCIDIIQHEGTTETGFASYWHTLQDNMDNVSRETLKVVGQTVLHVIYNE